MSLLKMLWKTRKWIVALLLVGVFLTVLPFLVQFSLLYSISRTGVGRASLKDVDINLFSGAFSFRQFHLNNKKNSLLDVGEMFVDYGWRGLFDREYRIEKFTLNSVRFSVNQTDDGVWHVIVPLHTFGKSHEQAAELTGTPLILPRLNARQIQFTDLEIDISSSQLNGTLVIDKLDLQRLSSWEEEPAALTLHASWNSAPLEADLRAEWINRVPVIKGSIKGQGLQLAELQPLLRETLQTLGGTAQFEFDVEGSRNATGVTAMKLTGKVRVSEIAMQYQNYHLDNAQTNWDGTVAFSLGKTFQIGSLSGAIDSETCSMLDTSRAEQLAAFERLTVENLGVNADHSIRADRVHFKNLTALRPDKEQTSLVNSSELAMESLQLNTDNRLHIATVTVAEGRIDSDILGASNPYKAMELAAFEQLTVDNLIVSKDRALSSDQIRFKNLTALRPEKERKNQVTIRELTMASSQLNSDKQLRIATVTAADGQIDSEVLGTSDHSRAMELAAFELLTIDDLLVKENQSLSSNRVYFKNLTALRPLKEEQSWLNTGKLTMDTIQFEADKQLHIGHITVTDGQYQLLVDSAGKLRFASVLSADTKNSATSQDGIVLTGSDQAQRESAADNRLSIRIDEFEVTGDSFVEIQDASVGPPLRKKIQIEQLRIQDLNQLDPDKKVSVNIATRIDEFSELTLAGWLTPFSQQNGASITGKLDDLSLPGFSPYSEKHIGYQIPSGQLDDDFKISIKNQKLSIKNKLYFRHFELQEVDRDKAEGFAASLGVPVGLGLDLIRDNDGSIKISVPITGQMNDPSIKINKIVGKALGKAITKASIQYLKYAIQPYGSLLVAGDFIGKQWSSVTLAPVLFPLGMDQLSEQHMDYLNKIAELLHKRQKLELTVCGYITNDDQSELAALTPKKPVDESQLVALAKNRSLYVKRYLVSKGINSKRLSLCKTSLKNRKISGVTLSM